MIAVNIHEAKTHLSRLLARVAACEEVILAKAGKPIARLVPYRKLKGERPLGLDKGRYLVPADFDAALQKDLLATFEGEP